MSALTTRLSPGAAAAATAVANDRPVPGQIGGRQKAAIIVRLLLAVGDQVPLRDLPDHLQAALTEQIGRMRVVDRATLDAVVEEFLALLDSIGLSFPGGIDGALQMLDGQISATAAGRLKRLSGASSKADPWDRIAALESEKLLPVLAEESAEVGAVMLSKIAVSRAAELLGKLPGERARHIAYAMGQTGEIDPETVRRIGLSLAVQLESRPLRAFEAEPHERIGAILNVSPATTRDEVLSGLAEADQGLAERVRKSIFTFADIAERIEGRDISRVIRGVEQAALVNALAGARTEADTASAEFILANMSQRMAATLRDEMAERGKVREKDAEAAMTSIVSAVRKLVDAGELVLRMTADAEED